MTDKYISPGHRAAAYRKGQAALAELDYPFCAKALGELAAKEEALAQQERDTTCRMFEKE